MILVLEYAFYRLVGLLCRFTLEARNIKRSFIMPLKKGPDVKVKPEKE